MALPATDGDSRSGGRKPVWDLPLRVFHWGLVCCFVTAWLTRTDRYLDAHVFAGYLAAGLLVFRLLWGVFGGTHSRFDRMTFGWRVLGEYLAGLRSGNPRYFVGHNPAGAWAVYLMLALMLGLVVSGLLTLGGEERHGPFAGWLSIAEGTAWRELHTAAAWLMLGLVGVHLSGVLVESRIHGVNLTSAMLNGCKPAPAGMAPVATRRAIGVSMLLACAAFAGWWFHGYLAASADRPYLPFAGPALPDNALWREECGGCHLAYHPSLLPARSWQRLVDGQERHFGEDLALDEAILGSIRHFLVANSAQRGLTEAGWKINHSIPENATPVRITETPYWKRKHAVIGEETWRDGSVNGRGNCPACHLDATRGTFEDAAMRLPTPH